MLAGFGQLHRVCAVGLGVHPGLRRFTLRADILGQGITLRTHAVVGLLQHVIRKIGAAHADIDNFDAERIRFGAQLVADLAHHHRTVGRQCGIERAAAIGLTQGGIETGGDTGLRLQQVGAKSFTEQAGILDAGQCDGIDDIDLGGHVLHRLVVGFPDDDAVLDQRYRIGEGQFEIQARKLDDVVDVAETQDQRLVFFIDDKIGQIKK